MRLLGNILWLVFGGVIGFVFWTVAGVLFCVTIIGIPFGVQALKLGGFALWPFGRDTEVGTFGVGGAIGNAVWILLFGWELAVYHLIAAVILSITIIGIPFGKQHIKLARLALLPFGARIRPID
jgi:uncharacterized membrane protein YccF (DUF307 family)